MIILGRRGLRFQILLLLTFILIVPVLVMLYDLFFASKSDEVVLENRERYLSEIMNEMASGLEYNEDETPRQLVNSFTQEAGYLVRENKGVRLGIYIVENEKMYIEGFLHEYRKLTKQEQIERERRISGEVSAGIQSVLATGEKIVRVGRTWDDEILECLRPVRVKGKIVAVVWAEQMMHPIFAKSYNFRMVTRYTTLVIFCFSLFCVVAVVLNLTRNINTIKEGLESLEADIDFRLEPLPGEMGQITTAINNMGEGLAEREQLKEKLRQNDFLAALGRLVTGIAHELRNPLGVLMATVEVMEEDLQNCDGIKDYAERIKKQVDRQSKTVNGLLDFGRPDDGMLEKLDLNELLLNVMDFAQPLLQKSNVDISTHLEQSLPHVVGSAEKLQQVFLNLIINAIQAMPSGGSIIITSGSTGEEVFATVNDTGKGIPENDLEHIFEPFYTTKDGGSGLGLSISNQVVRIHGGRIIARSTPGKGTEMTVCLPFLMKGEIKHEA